MHGDSKRRPGAAAALTSAAAGVREQLPRVVGHADAVTASADQLCQSRGGDLIACAETEWRWVHTTMSQCPGHSAEANIRMSSSGLIPDI